MIARIPSVLEVEPRVMNSQVLWFVDICRCMYVCNVRPWWADWDWRQAFLWRWELRRDVLLLAECSAKVTKLMPTMTMMVICVCESKSEGSMKNVVCCSSTAPAPPFTPDFLNVSIFPGLRKVMNIYFFVLIIRFFFWFFICFFYVGRLEESW